MYKYKVLAVILARGGSKGIKKKNIYPLNNYPLISYSIQAAKESKYISDILVSSDSSEIIRIAKLYGADAPFKRPKILSGDRVASVTSLHHAVEKYEKYKDLIYDYIIELPCIAPLRDSIDIDNSLEILIKNKYDSVISYVETGEKHPTRLKRIINNRVSNFCKDYSEPDIGSRRQDFEKCFIRNGAIYSMKRDVLIKLKSRNGKKSFPFIMPDFKSINIDTKFDLLSAKLLIENGFCNNKPKIFKDTNKYKNYYKNNKKYKLLINSPFDFMRSMRLEYNKFFDCKFLYNQTNNNLEKEIKECDIWICHPSPKFKINKTILKNAKKLKIIATPSTGTNHIDTDYCKKNKIKILSLKNDPEIKKIKASSEFTFLLILSALKNANQAFIRGRSGQWRENERSLRGSQLYNKKIGIIGLGRIGSNIAKYSKPFGAKIIGYDPNVKSLKGVKIINNLNLLLAQSDIICICIHLSKKTYKFVSKEKFEKMKNGVIFINSSRGDVVDEHALLKNLKNKKIKFACLDVLKNEHLLPNNQNEVIKYAKNNDNLIITPHMAGLTNESEILAAKITLKNIKKNLFEMKRK